jgi:hypothetical protein
MALSTHLISQLLSKETSTPTNSQSTKETRKSPITLTNTNLEKLSEEEAEALLLAELDNKPDKGS